MLCEGKGFAACFWGAGLMGSETDLRASKKAFFFFESSESAAKMPRLTKTASKETRAISSVAM